MKTEDYNIAYFKKMLSENRDWLENGILRLYQYQTDIEKSHRTAEEENGMGFNKPDSNVMTKYARWILSGNHLTGSYYEDAKIRIQKYSGQLLKLAIAKRDEKAKLDSGISR